MTRSWESPVPHIIDMQFLLLFFSVMTRLSVLARGNLLFLM